MIWDVHLVAPASFPDVQVKPPIRDVHPSDGRRDAHTERIKAARAQLLQRGDNRGWHFGGADLLNVGGMDERGKSAIRAAVDLDAISGDKWSGALRAKD